MTHYVHSDRHLSVWLCWWKLWADAHTRFSVVVQNNDEKCTPTISSEQILIFSLDKWVIRIQFLLFFDLTNWKRQYNWELVSHIAFYIARDRFEARSNSMKRLMKKYVMAWILWCSKCAVEKGQIVVAVTFYEDNLMEIWSKPMKTCYQLSGKKNNAKRKPNNKPSDVHVYLVNNSHWCLRSADFEFVEAFLHVKPTWNLKLVICINQFRWNKYGICD